MESSYIKAANRPDLMELSMDSANPWELAEELHQDYFDLLKRVAYLENELMTFLENKPTTITQPQVTKNTWWE